MFLGLLGYLGAGLGVSFVIRGRCFCGFLEEWFCEFAAILECLYLRVRVPKLQPRRLQSGAVKQLWLLLGILPKVECEVLRRSYGNRL